MKNFDIFEICKVNDIVKSVFKRSYHDNNIRFKEDGKCYFHNSNLSVVIEKKEKGMANFRVNDKVDIPFDIHSTDAAEHIRIELVKAVDNGELF